MDAQQWEQIGLGVGGFALLTMVLRWIGTHGAKWIEASMQSMQRRDKIAENTQQQLTEQTMAQRESAESQRKFAESAAQQTEALKVLVELGKSSLEYEEINNAVHGDKFSHFATVLTETSLLHKIEGAIATTVGIVTVLQHTEAIPDELRPMAKILLPHFQRQLKHFEAARDTLKQSRHIDA